MKIKDLVINNKKNIIFNRDLLEKPYSQYISMGNLAEQIFRDYCQKSGLQIIGMGEFSYRLLLYGRHNAEKGKFFYNQLERSNYKKKNIEQFMAMFSKEQIKFLEQNHQHLYYEPSQKIVGLPDFFVWDDTGKFAFVEVKSGSATLNTRQRNVIKKLILLFSVYICHVSCDITFKDLEINNIDFGLVSVNKAFKFDKGAAVEESLYLKSHKKLKNNIQKT